MLCQKGIQTQQVSAINSSFINAIVLIAGVGQPRNISVNVLSSSMVHIMWLPPHPAQQNGPISYYAVSLYSIETYETSQYNTTTASIQFTGLHPFYNYECYVAAFTVGLGPNKVITFQMAEDGIIRRHNLLLYFNVLL